VDFEQVTDYADDFQASYLQTECIAICGDFDDHELTEEYAIHVIDALISWETHCVVHDHDPPEGDASPHSVRTTNGGMDIESLDTLCGK